jgi:glycosyltransferase involved in cell wall biosynthesis
MVNTPDLSVFVRRGKKRRDEKIILIYPGTLNWHQGVDIAIRAVASLKDKLPTLEFHIYGEGEARVTLMQLALELGLKDRVLFHDVCPIREIARKIEEADLGIVAKRADSFGDEAFSTKILEFMCLGVPTIVSGTTIDRYYFNDSITQFFRSGDVVDLANRILGLAQHTDARDAMAKRASEFAVSMTWDVHKGHYLRIVDGLVGGHRGHVQSLNSPSPSPTEVAVEQSL